MQAEGAALAGAPVEEGAIEEPDVEAVLHLVDAGDGGGHIAPSGVPLDVGAHEVLRRVHHLAVIRAEELQLPIHCLEPAQYQELALQPRNNVSDTGHIPLPHV